jgi:hypothetical protein
MTIREMHYDFKQKLNKIDSQKYRNLRVPEIDWKLNEAQEVYIKVIAEPRLRNGLGFEVNQRTIDDIRSLVVKDTIPAQVVPDTEDKIYLAPLPQEYMFYLTSEVKASKGSCEAISFRKPYLVQHDDDSEYDAFASPSFEWREVNIRFDKDGIKIFTDGTFSIDSLSISYIKKPLKIHNAQDAQGGNYKDLGTGLLLTGSQDCELPEHTHREIVDLAVLIATGDLQISDYQVKANKIKLTN